MHRLGECRRRLGCGRRRKPWGKVEGGEDEECEGCAEVDGEHTPEGGEDGMHGGRIFKRSRST